MVALSRLSIITNNKAEATVESLYKDLERRIIASPPGLCPLDLASSFLKVCAAQTCGKCVPCRVGLPQLERLIEDILDGKGTLKTIEMIEKTAEAITDSADCAIGFEAASMVLKGVRGFRDDYVEHVEKGRCMFGLDQPVPCVSLCPAHVDVPGYIALVAEGRFDDAIRLIRKDNPFPTVCAMVCEHPCERRCRRNMVDDSVNIRGLKLYAVEHASSDPVESPSAPTGKRIAIVGGGPSGITAAYYLALMGHEPEIFEQRKHLGGMLRYGIPAYRLPREALQAEIDTLLSVGIKVHTEHPIGEEHTLADLRREFDAVYIAIGAHTDRPIRIPGEDADGVVSAVSILRRIGDGDYPQLSGLDVVVVGGGNVAMDCARSAIRLGANSVSLAYRRRREDMTAMPEEIEATEAEGCQIYELAVPTKVEVDDHGRAAALWIQQQMISTVKDGRPAPRPLSNEPQRLKCDLIIVAVGQGIESKNFEKDGVAVQTGSIASLESQEVLGMPGIFAGGDCVSGPATVIRAIAAGKVAAANIDEYLGFDHKIETSIVIPDPVPHDAMPCGRINLRERPLVDRVRDFEKVECGMSAEEAKQEARRCMRCDHFGLGVFKGGRQLKW